MGERFYIELQEIQPSQLYISAAKLARVQALWRPPRLASIPPVPVMLLDGLLVSTDGHTRALAAYRQGLRMVPVYWDEDDLDREAYQICVEWCREAGIHTLRDLEGRVLDASAYATLWLDRCRRMQAALAVRRQ